METTEIIREPRRLSRPRDGRWLGGVSAGLGAYFDLSPAIYRIAFVALALAGGTGILLYIAAWLVIPGEGEDDSIAAAALKRTHDRPGRVVGLALIAFVLSVLIVAVYSSISGRERSPRMPSCTKGKWPTSRKFSTMRGPLALTR